tara:strand:- start:321 stop:674 length:354 start_codon:yes stop_codon:yes gene_type:complete
VVRWGHISGALELSLPPSYASGGWTDVFQVSEIINLAVDLISFPVLLVVVSRTGLPRYRLFVAAIVAMVASHLFTIVEGVAFPELFNLAEHLSLLAASVLFFVGTVRYFLGSDGWTV